MENKHQKSFTLIEILVVTTIIGLLAGIGAVSYSRFTKQSRDAKRKTDLEQIRGALEMYRSDMNSYPISTGDTTPTPGIPLGFSSTALVNPTLTPGVTYLNKFPKDPKDPTYNYTYDSTGSDYTMGTYLETGSGSCSGLVCGENNCNYCIGPYGEK